MNDFRERGQAEGDDIDRHEVSNDGRKFASIYSDDLASHIAPEPHGGCGNTIANKIPDHIL